MQAPTHILLGVVALDRKQGATRCPAPPPTPKPSAPNLQLSHPRCSFGCNHVAAQRRRLLFDCQRQLLY